MKPLLPAVLCCAAALTATPLSPNTVHAQESAETASAVPQPDAVTHDWKFDFKFSKPDTIAVENAEGGVDWYWYMTYTVTNYDYDELFFDPKIVIQDNTGRIVTANLGVGTRVFDAVRNLIENPLLVSPLDVPGRVLKGEDYARQSVIIWKDAKKDIDSFRVFIGGIYGESKVVNDPSTGKPIMIPVIDALTGKPKVGKDGEPLMQPLLVHRTRMLRYTTPGTTIVPQDPSIRLAEDRDVMR